VTEVKTKANTSTHPLLSKKERLSALKSIRGMWKNCKPDPIKELKKMRSGWNRKLPSLK
jgi:hypothetical protein